jgi:hypothetical protein
MKLTKKQLDDFNYGEPIIVVNRDKTQILCLSMSGSNNSDYTEVDYLRYFLSKEEINAVIARIERATALYGDEPQEHRPTCIEFFNSSMHRVYPEKYSSIEDVDVDAQWKEGQDAMFNWFSIGSIKERIYFPYADCDFEVVWLIDEKHSSETLMTPVMTLTTLKALAKKLRYPK